MSLNILDGSHELLFTLIPPEIKAFWTTCTIRIWGDVVVFFAEGVGRGKSAEHRVVLTSMEVVEIQAVHAIKLFAWILIAVGRRKDIAEIATCRVRHIGISREANERRDNQRYDMSKVHIHLTKLMLYLKYDCFVLLANVHTPSELTKFYRQI